ncbi:20126_t:CDS:10 [Cetraspora pellucida]|uniref:20126_t:CDS:1 n=1 Tax=Cetraspora pellucida TaxID=1433469 RepID=A0A9N8W0I2_9GLOM|nr:20126_t:CDS:10 [Cetraspora pellucida]
MADADPDGRHIEFLLKVLFARYFRYLIEEHRLYLAVPPRYRWQSKKETKYFYSDYEWESYRQEHKSAAGRLQHIKGLGEMNALEFRENVMSIRKRCLHELLFLNPPSIREIIRELAGEKSDQRKKYLESGEHKNAQLKIIESIESSEDFPQAAKRVDRIDFRQALLTKFLEYAYTVVEDRALPQLQDGLKPVQRKILYTLYLHKSAGFRKSAKIVGDVVGSFHPHGDQSVYQAMVKMAQDFNYRYPLVDPQVDNYDETEKEPKILPANLNFLLNGGKGIAVGMTTEIPPHNLGETVDTTVNLIRNPDLSIEELLQTLPGPDFPTGGIILNQKNLVNIYKSGHGSIYVRGKAEILANQKDKERKDLIRIVSLPFKVNKTKLVAHINQLIKGKKIDEVILNQLYQSTRLQSSLTVKMRALIDEYPRVFNLKEILQGFIEKRLINIQDKARFIYRENEKSLVNLQTRQFIIDNYRAIAEIVRNADSEEVCEQELKTHFQIPDETVKRILDTQASFRQFTPERREKLERDIQEKQADNQQQQLLIENEELIPAHEERIILLSRQDNKKENKIRSYVTIYQLNALEATNIPSQGKDYGHLYVVNFYKFNLVNKSINWEEYDNKEQHRINCCSQKPFQEAYLNCPEFRALQKAIREYEELIIVFKKKDKKGQVRNFQTSAYQIKRNSYYSEEFGRSLTRYCSLHQPLAEEHQRSSCCDKNQGVKAYARCPQFQSLMLKIRNCATCQNRNDATLFSRKIRQQVRRCEEALDLLKVPAATSPEDLTFLLIKQDNNYLGQNKEELGEIKSLLKETKENFCQEVCNSSLPREGEQSKKEIILNTSINLTKELREKIANSPHFQAEGENYKRLLGKKRKLEERVQSFANKNTDCLDCRKHCQEHENLTNKYEEEHRNCTHCKSKVQELGQVKEKIKQMENELLQQKENRPEFNEKITKLEKKIGLKEEKISELQREISASRLSCQMTRELEQGKKNCKNCQELKRKKHKKIIVNPLRHVTLVNKQGKSEIYLLTKKSIMWNGEKRKARKIVYQAAELVATKVSLPFLTVFEGAMANTKPNERREHLGLLFIVKSAWEEKEKSSLPFFQVLAGTIFDAYHKKGSAIQKKEAIHKKGEENKAFATFLNRRKKKQTIASGTH